MTSQRIYREPLSSLAARAELRICSGSQFDPYVVEVLMHILAEEDSVSQDFVTNRGLPGNMIAGQELSRT